MNILLTGGAGYIGSHTAVVLSQAGHEVILLDNFSNSNPSVIEDLQKILGKSLICIEADVRDTATVAWVLREYKINAVIHFAGLKSVGDSGRTPITYYDNNLVGTINLIRTMAKCSVKKIIFSSSAAVYGAATYLPIDELHPACPASPYGRNKLQIEEFLKDVYSSDNEWRVLCLRYFNPVGAHESGLIGEDSSNAPSNLMPLLAMVADGNLPYLNVYGDDYDTFDGSGVRDYIHVMDVAEGHVAGLKFLENNATFEVVNLGTGRGYSVYQMVSAYELVSQCKIECRVSGRRPGDVGASFSSSSKARDLLGWVAKRNLTQICNDLYLRRLKSSRR